MDVLVQGKALSVTPSLREYVGRQADKLKRVCKNIIGVRVFLENIERKSSDQHRSVVKYKVELPGKDICVRSQSNDLYKAIVEATESAVRHVRKQFEKRRTLTRNVTNRRHAARTM
ncbi:MAG: ribosome hibernation-promoting factor, HPF/YfiA family [Patescibacteria group bacterium]